MPRDRNRLTHFQEILEKIHLLLSENSSQTREDFLLGLGDRREKAFPGWVNRTRLPRVLLWLETRPDLRMCVTKLTCLINLMRLILVLILVLTWLETQPGRRVCLVTGRTRIRQCNGRGRSLEDLANQ